jgi:hypothetical protein
MSGTQTFQILTNNFRPNIGQRFCFLAALDSVIGRFRKSDARLQPTYDDNLFDHLVGG